MYRALSPVAILVVSVVLIPGLIRLVVTVFSTAELAIAAVVIAAGGWMVHQNVKVYRQRQEQARRTRVPISYCW